MRPINRVLTIDITHHEKGIVAGFFHDGDLVGGCVRAEAQILVVVICVGWAARDMVRRDIQCIEAIMGSDLWVEVLKQLELLAGHPHV